MVSNPESIKQDENKQANVTDDDWLKNVRSSNYRGLKFFVPRCRNAVTARETTKSILVRMVHSFRLAYRRLAQLLYEGGKLPDPGLVFFVTHTELRDLVHSKTGASSLVAKAVRRRKLHAEMDQMIFPEISRGIPKPQNKNQEHESVNTHIFPLVDSAYFVTSRYVI